MRISADKDNVGYVPAEQRRGVQIRLDGQELSEVITADEEQGYVCRIMRDDQHRIVTKGGTVATEELRGTVEVILPSGRGHQKSRGLGG